jgi:hypothetical protein
VRKILIFNSVLDAIIDMAIEPTVPLWGWTSDQMQKWCAREFDPLFDQWYAQHFGRLDSMLYPQFMWPKIEYFVRFYQTQEALQPGLFELADFAPTAVRYAIAWAGRSELRASPTRSKKVIHTTAFDEIVALGKDPTDPLCVGVGNDMEKWYAAQFGQQPEKDLHDKKNGGGSHCYAYYAEFIRAKIHYFVRNRPSQSGQQWDLFGPEDF